MTIIGIDPGKSGAIAVLNGGTWEDTVKLSETEQDVSCFVKYYTEDADSVFAYIERVSAMPKQGVSSTFKFGQSYGFLRGLLVAMRIPFEEVSPVKWQRAMGCLSKGVKNVTKAKAQQIFPDVKITHATADALLIAEYGRRLRAGELVK